jgi:hypothetical protein
MIICTNIVSAQTLLNKYYLEERTLTNVRNKTTKSVYYYLSLTGVVLKRHAFPSQILLVVTSNATALKIRNFKLDYQ